MSIFEEIYYMLTSFIILFQVIPVLTDVLDHAKMLRYVSYIQVR